MATTHAPAPAAPFAGIEETNASGYQRALKLGMRHNAAMLAAEHPEYLAYYKFVDPMDFRVAFANRDSVNAVLTRLGYDVSGFEDIVREAPAEDIRPRRGW